MDYVLKIPLQSLEPLKVKLEFSKGEYGFGGGVTLKMSFEDANEAANFFYDVGASIQELKQQAELATL